MPKKKTTNGNGKKNTSAIIKHILSDVIDRRIDIKLYFDAINSNPNGDNVTGHPRQDPVTNQGLVRDACIKSWLRNFIRMQGHAIVMDPEGPTLEETYNNALKQSGTDKDGRTWLCENTKDTPLFGAVVTGDQAKSARSDIHAPVQFNLACSVDPIEPRPLGLTRCVAAKRKANAKGDETDTGRMGSVWIVPYGLYESHCYISPNHAKRRGNGKSKFRGTGMTWGDFELLLQALLFMFDFNRSSTRSEMNMRKLVVFEHDDDLGSAPADKLFELVKAVKKTDEAPTCFEDYQLTVDVTPLQDNPHVSVYELSRTLNGVVRTDLK